MPSFIFSSINLPHDFLELSIGVTYDQFGLYFHLNNVYYPNENLSKQFNQRNFQDACKNEKFCQKKNICVLSTVSGNKPHCLLMANITDATSEEIYMVTHQSTTKFNNLQHNPLVSLLIDSRETQQRSNAQALTIDGVFASLTDENQEQKIRDRMLESFPHMQDFINHLA